MQNAIGARTVPFGHKKAKQNRIHGSACERRLRTATTPPCSRRVKVRLLTPPLLCPNETARLEASTHLDTGSRPDRWAYFGARTRERNDVEERPPDAHHGSDHRCARYRPAYAVQRHRLRGKRRALGPEHGGHAVRGCRVCPGAAPSGSTRS